MVVDGDAVDDDDDDVGSVIGASFSSSIVDDISLFCRFLVVVSAFGVVMYLSITLFKKNIGISNINRPYSLDV